MEQAEYRTFAGFMKGYCDMEIKYSDTKDFDAEDIERLFLSVKWDSGQYPWKLVRGMHNTTNVVSA